MEFVVKITLPDDHPAASESYIAENLAIGEVTFEGTDKGGNGCHLHVIGPNSGGVDPIYREVAKELHHRDGECEIDEDAIVSLSDDGGAYVASWVWVSDEDLNDEQLVKVFGSSQVHLFRDGKQPEMPLRDCGSGYAMCGAKGRKVEMMDVELVTCEKCLELVKAAKKKE